MCKEKEKRDCIDCPIGFEPVPDMPGLFVSTDGDVRLLNKNGDLIRPIFTVTGKGYLRITYCSGRYYVHRLVAQTYIANPRDCKYVNHKNGNKLDNRMENLEWVTASENWRHAEAIGLTKSIGEIMRKLSDDDVRYIRSVDTRTAELAKKFNVTTRTIAYVRAGKTFKNVK